jgi:peptide/nickel transport system permease protein
MLKLILRRLVLLIPTLLGIILLTFIIFKLTPGDPVEMMLQNAAATPERVAALRAELGLNDPILIQFVRYVWRILHGDLGRSFNGGFPVLDAILARFPATLELAVAAMTLAVLLGLTLGTVAGTVKSRAVSDLIMFFSLWGMAVPQYWLSAIFIIVFAVKLKLIPVLGGAGLTNLILPAFALSLGPGAALARLTQASVETVICSDFVRTARGKGLTERIIVLRHVLSNALIPVVTMIGLQFGAMLGGTVFIEAAFSRPGLGTFALAAITNRDYPQIQGVVLFGAVAFVLVNLAVDILYSFLDPRIRYD